MIKKAVEKKINKFIQAKGGRKTAQAVARVIPNESGLVVNDKDYKEYFKIPKNQVVAFASFDLLKIASKIRATVKVYGGGINAQAEAVRNAIARALVKYDESLKSILRRAGFLTRDARMVERKKYGLKKARRAPQWAKR